MPTTEISKLLDHCPNLTSLDLEYGHIQPGYDIGLEFHFPGQPRIYGNATWKSVTDSLLSKSQSLQCLKLSTDLSEGTWSLDDTEVSDESVVGSLNHFTALRRLSVSANGFIGSYEWHDACLGLKYEGFGRPDGSPTDRLGLLPPSIEYLEITNIQRDMTLNHLEQAVSVLQTRFPRLRHIDVGSVEYLIEALDVPDQVVRARLLVSDLKAIGIVGVDLPDHWIDLDDSDDSTEEESEEDYSISQTPATPIDIEVGLAKLQWHKRRLDH